MSIQSNINQAMSLAGLLYSQSPKGQAKAEEAKAEASRQRQLSQLGKKEQALTKASGIIQESTIQRMGGNDGKLPYERKAEELRDIDLLEQYGEEIQGIRKQRFELDPTAEGLGKLAPSSEQYEAVAKELVKQDPSDPTYSYEDPADIARDMYEHEQFEAAKARSKEQFETEVNRYLDMYRNQTRATQAAQQALQIKQQEKRDGRKTFLDYLDEPTSLGGKVSDLDPKLRALIADQLGEDWEFGKKGTR